MLNPQSSGDGLSPGGDAPVSRDPALLGNGLNAFQDTGPETGTAAHHPGMHARIPGWYPFKPQVRIPMFSWVLALGVSAILWFLLARLLSFFWR